MIPLQRFSRSTIAAYFGLTPEPLSCFHSNLTTNLRLIDTISAQLAVAASRQPAPRSTCLADRLAGDIDEMARLAVEAINTSNYELVVECLSNDETLEELISIEPNRPLVDLQPCKLMEWFECWVKTEEHFWFPIDINSGSAGEFITGVSTIGGGA